MICVRNGTMGLDVCVVGADTAPLLVAPAKAALELAESATDVRRIRAAGMAARPEPELEPEAEATPFE